MQKLLWINACMRGRELSRTDGLCREFISAFLSQHPEVSLVERDLTRADLPVMTAQLSQQRHQAMEEGLEISPLLEPARELAEADYVVVGAPYWDLSFPAALKIYLEWASTLGITFRYTREGASEGLCRAEKLLYITTAGGQVAGQNFGFDYVKSLGAMLGISQAVCVAAQDLDVQGGPGQENLEKARAHLVELAKEW